MKRLALLATAATLLLAACGGSSASDQAASSSAPTVAAESSATAAAPAIETITPGVLTVGTSADYAPMEYVDETGAYVGFDLDLIRDIAQRSGLTVEVISTSFDTLLPQLQSGKFDVVIAGMAATDERKQSYDFSKPYFVFREAVGVAADSTIASAAGLDGAIVGVQSGTIFETQAPELFPGATIKAFPETTQIVNAVRAGQIDAGYMDEVAVVAAADEGGGIKVGFTIDNPNPDPIGIAVNKGATDLLAAIDAGIDAAVADGTYVALYQQYLKGEPPAQFQSAG